jgi:hypothetical protein
MASAAATAPSKAGLGDQALRAAPARLASARARDAAVTAARLTARWRRPQKSVIARWTIQPRLLGVPGVANVAIWGANTLDVTGARFPSDGGQTDSAGGADLIAGRSR